ncbi:MAG: hypothetical protein HRT66_03375 [Flavobacteriaceae bacterium]|nr:hypothetical protein [Flavobacteriaceae bacterium]
MRNLENYGVQQMNAKEMEEVNGGDAGVVALIALVMIVGGWIARMIAKKRNSCHYT